MMNYTIQRIVWPKENLPAGASVWTFIAGRLTGYGQHRRATLRDYFSLHIVTRGRGIVKTKHGTWAVKAGDMFTVWPGVWIEYAEDPSHPWTYYWTHLIGPGAPDFVRACGFTANRPVLRPLKPRVVICLMKRILAVFHRRRAADESRVLAWMYEMLSACSRQQHLPPPHPQKNRYQALIERVTLFLQPCLHTLVNINQLADKMQVSRITLFRAFRETFGITPIAYLASLRIRKACTLLTESSHSLSIVARAAGFASEKYFMRCFKLATGQTPTAYRQAHQRSLMKRHRGNKNKKAIREQKTVEAGAPEY